MSSSNSLDTDKSSHTGSSGRSMKSVRWLEDKFSNLTEQFSKEKQTTLPPTNFPLNIGIYFEEGLVTLGTTSVGSKECEKIRSFASVITFTNEKIYVLKIIPNHIHFNLDVILKQSSHEKHSFIISTTSFNLSPEEILAFYFEKVLSKVKAIRRAETIGNIVLTIPFNVTCLERERLRQAFKIAGYSQLRIFSTMAPITVWYLLEENSIFSETIHSKLVLVVHSLKHSFSMALLQASFNSIVVKSSVVSEDLKEFQDMPFYVGHAQMFSSQGKHQEIVWMAYKAAVERILTDTSGQRIDKVIGLTKPKNVKKLRQILGRFFSENALTMIDSNEPLAGACIYASRASMTSNSLPSDIQIREAFRSNVVLIHGTSRYAARVKNNSFNPGVVASVEVPVVPSQEIVITLQEEFANGHKVFPVSRYRMSVGSDNPEKEKKPTPVMVKCSIETDQDGILTVVPKFPQRSVLTNSLFVRLDELSKPSSADSDYGRLNSYYKSQVNYPGGESQELVRELTKDAVLFYSVSMKTFDPKGKSPQEILAEHQRLKKEAQEKFTKDCEKNGVDSKTAMTRLESKLDSIFQDVKKFFSNSKDKIKGWINRKKE